MLDNALNRNDLRHLVRRLKRRGPATMVREAFGGKEALIAETWSTVERAPTHAWDVPEVIARRNRLITGDESLEHVEWFVSTHLAGRTNLVALSVGCGDGRRERSWARTGRFAR